MITLVQFFVNLLRPYADMPEFTTCVMKAMRELKRPVNKESIYRKPAKEPAKSCRICEPECKE
jgi:hypothetical protein